MPEQKAPETTTNPAPVLVLASASASRQAMLRAAGVPFLARPAAVDERALEAALGDASPAAIALALAQAKAQAIAPECADGWPALVLGGDSLLEAAGRRFDKAATREEAAEHLRFFSGRELQLHSAAALVREGAVVWRHGAMARLAVRPLSERFIEAYLDAEWPAASGCVGVFRIEGRGVHLFQAISGDHFTVLGMPLLEVLAGLRALGAIGA